jgi:tRNA pseudouridine55 synthase
MDGIIYVNKPKGYTSFDVCNKLKRFLGTKKIGHTGTLDPNATGVLVLMIGKAVKCNQFLLNSDKEYVAEIKLGVKTDTADIWGNVLEEKEYTKPDINEIKEVLKSFLGKQEQLPPMTSAIKVNGMKLYEYQRKGIEVEIPKRNIEIYNIELLDYTDTIKFKVMVSKGTYIRSLVEDIAEKLGTIGTMSSLVRTEVNGITTSMCYTLEEIIEGNYVLNPIYDVLKKEYTMHEVDDVDYIKHGKRLELDYKDDIIMIVNNKEVIAAYERDQNKIYRSKRGLW